MKAGRPCAGVLVGGFVARVLDEAHFRGAIRSVHYYLCELPANSSNASSFFHFALVRCRCTITSCLQTPFDSARPPANVAIAYMPSPNSRYLLVLIWVGGFSRNIIGTGSAVWLCRASLLQPIEANRARRIQSFFFFPFMKSNTSTTLRGSTR